MNVSNMYKKSENMWNVLSGGFPGVVVFGGYKNCVVATYSQVADLAFKLFCVSVHNCTNF